jgi:uncharacterized protein YggE
MKYAILLCLVCSSAFAAMDVPQVMVQGHCEIKVVPDRGSILFTSEHQSKDQKEAVKKTIEQMAKLKDAIKELKLEDLEFKNSEYTVYPVREYEKDRLIDKGYKASLSLELTTSQISRIGETMTKASDLGVINAQALTTFLSLEKGQKEYLKCLDIAADDAKNKAIQLGKKLGFKVGDVITLNEVPQIENTPIPIRAMMTKSLDSAPPQIEAGTQKYSTNIQVTFSIK